jgi:protein SCO1/2
MSFEAGRDYRPIALSFSDTEDAATALRAKKNYLKLVYDGFPADEWKFLTGSREAIQAVTDSFGYRFKKMDDETYIHPSAMIAVGADGKIIRYVYGSFVPGDIDMAIAAAREGVPALSVKRLLDFCFNYDPNKNKTFIQYVKFTVLFMFAVSLAFVFFFFGRKRRLSKDRHKQQISNEQDEMT